MDLPSILSAGLKNVESALNDQELYELLLVSTERLSQFFAFAADDETWSLNHETFYRLALGWFTKQYLQDRLAEKYIKSITKSLQEHYLILNPWIPRPILVQVGELSFSVNPLLVSEMSSYFRSVLKKEIHDKNVRTLRIAGAQPDLLPFVFNYLENGNSEEIWKFKPFQIEQLLALADLWGIPRLSQACEEILKRYIDLDNVSGELVAAFKKNRRILLEKCLQVFNEKFANSCILNIYDNGLSFEFLNFEGASFEAFAIIQNYVTHLCFKGDLTLDDKFIEVIEQAPKLTGLKLSETNEWSPLFLQIPPKIYDLDLSKCSWLNDRELRQFLSLVPKVSLLSLAHNTQLTYRGFAELKNLRGLKSLNLARCSQLENEELNLILQGNGGLNELNLYGCRRLSDGAFYELGKRAPHLQKVNFSRTLITDGGLQDFCLRCQELTDLSLDHCLSITETGLFDCLKASRQLKVLSIQGNRLSLTAVSSLKEKYPDTVISD